MVCARRRAACVVLVLSGLAAPGRADPPAEGQDPPAIADTQLTLRVGPLQGRATVIAASEDRLRVLTAAHFLSAEDVGKPVLILHGAALRGRLEAVAHNPAFRPSRDRLSDQPTVGGTVGIDTALATIRVELHAEAQRRSFARIRTAELTHEPVLRSSGQVLSVHIVDQTGVEHVVRAGNHLNPRCLAWGRGAYDTQRGDSGAGVFLMRKTAEGKARPILIGNVSQTDPRGAIASLAYRNERWIEEALADGPIELR